MPIVHVGIFIVCTEHWLQYLTTSAMRFEPVIRITFSLLQILVSSVGQAQRTDSMIHVLNLHNFFRRLAAVQNGVANMNKLSWSDSLAGRAERRVRCSSWRERRRFRLGPNANVARVRTRNQRLPVDRVVRAWFSEQDHFRRTSAELQGCTPWQSCLQYRAMINALHHSVGCALLPNCGRRRRFSVLLCFYEGGSTQEDTFDFRYGPQCSRCGSPLSFCEDGALCASCDHSDSSPCQCRKSCQEEGVGYGRLNSTSCTCDCDYGLGPNCDEPCRNPPALLDEDLCVRLAAVRDNPQLYNNTDPLDCQQFARQCPVQCSPCTPWPGTETQAVDYTSEGLIYDDDEEIDDYNDFDSSSLLSDVGPEQEDSSTYLFM